MTNSLISLVYAKSINNVIGNQGRLPWRLKEDLEFFKNLTQGHTVVMGRKTYESIGKLLNKRQNIILTRDLNFSTPSDDHGSCVAYSDCDVIKKSRSSQIFIIGGSEIYNIFFDKCDLIYETVVYKHFEGDTFLSLDYKDFVLSDIRTKYSYDNSCYFSFNTWLRCDE